jgi:hypothetical protein
MLTAANATALPRCCAGFNAAKLQKYSCTHHDRLTCVQIRCCALFPDNTVAQLTAAKSSTSRNVARTNWPFEPHVVLWHYLSDTFCNKHMLSGLCVQHTSYNVISATHLLAR